MGFFERFKPNKNLKAFKEGEEEIKDSLSAHDNYIEPEKSLEDLTSELNKRVKTKEIIGKNQEYIEESEDIEYLEKKNDIAAALEALSTQREEIIEQIERCQKDITETEDRIRIQAEEFNRRVLLSGNMSLPHKESLTPQEQRLYNYLASRKKDLNTKKEELKDIEGQIKTQKNLLDGGLDKYKNFIN